jgi:hypothetical protein
VGRFALDPETCRELECATSTLRDSIAVVVEALSGQRDGVYVRSSSMFYGIEQRLAP